MTGINPTEAARDPIVEEIDEIMNEIEDLQRSMASAQAEKTQSPTQAKLANIREQAMTDSSASAAPSVASAADLDAELDRAIDAEVQNASPLDGEQVNAVLHPDDLGETSGKSLLDDIPTSSADLAEEVTQEMVDAQWVSQEQSQPEASAPVEVAQPDPVAVAPAPPPAPKVVPMPQKPNPVVAAPAPVAAAAPQISVAPAPMAAAAPQAPAAPAPTVSMPSMIAPPASGGGGAVAITLAGNMTLQLSYEYEGQAVTIGFVDGALRLEMTDGTEFKIPVRRSSLRNAG